MPSDEIIINVDGQQVRMTRDELMRRKAAMQANTVPSNSNAEAVAAANMAALVQPLPESPAAPPPTQTAAPSTQTTSPAAAPVEENTDPQHKYVFQPEDAGIATEAYIHRIIRHGDNLILAWDNRSKYPRAVPDVQGEVALHIKGTSVVYLLKSEGVSFPFDHWTIHAYKVLDEYPYDGTSYDD